MSTDQLTADTHTAIDHDDQLQRMLDAYQRPVMKTVDRWFPLAATSDRQHVQSLLRQAIEQAFDAGACQTSHQPAAEAAASDDPRAQYTAGLRQLADLLDANPHLRLPMDGSCEGLEISVHVNQGQDQRAEMAAWIRALPGTKAKAAWGEYFRVKKRLGGPKGLHFKVLADRDEVCERIVVGTKEVTEEKPDPVLLAEIPLVPVTRTEEIVEWRCTSLLAGAGA